MNAFYVRKTAQTFDEPSQSWFDTYEAPGVEGKPVTVHVPREEQGTDAIRRYLLRGGADMPAPATSKEMIAEAVASEAPIIRRVAQVGWRDEPLAFVTHHGVYTSSDGPMLIPPLLSSMSIAPSPPQGTLAAWLEVIKSAKFSTAMIVALCIMFAAVLVRPLRRQSFGIVLVGPSRSGKSTAQLIAGSVLGFSTEDSLPSLNATTAGLMSAAVSFSDHAMPINEIGTVRGKKREIHEAVRETTYALLNGHDVIRHPSWSGIGSASTQTFRILAILSSEHSPDEWAARGGEFRDEGEMARLISFPVVMKGRTTVFDRSPRLLQGRALEGWDADLFKELIEGVALNNGVAFPHFLQDFVPNQAARLAKAEREMRRFERRAGRLTRSRVGLDIAAKFGLIFAGGMLAIDAGVLPFDRNVVGKAVWRACRAAIRALPDPKRELEADLETLSERLEGGSVIDLASALRKERQLMGQADGFRQAKRGGVEYVIRSEVFCSWFRDDARLRQVLLWLDTNGHLDHASQAKAGRSNAWAQRQVAWPDGTRPRSIVIYLPKGPEDLMKV